MKRIGVFRPLSIFAVSSAWFSFLISWTGFIDPDAFYHAKASLLLWQHGPLMTFPWLDLTLFGTHFADLHFLFHVLIAPCIAFFGMNNGIRIATVLLSALFVTIFDACIRWLRVRWSIVWTTSLLFSFGLVLRLLLGKATPLALLWFIFGLTAAWKRRPWLVAFAAFGFALSHGGWLYLAFAVPLLLVGDVLFSRVVEEKPFVAALFGSLWKESVAGFVGGFVGLIVHPNVSGVFQMAWTQVVTIGLGTPFEHVNLGNEWLPADPGSLLATMAPWIIAALLGIPALAFAVRRPLDQACARRVVAFGFVLAAFVALTLKSQRVIEYLVPVSVLWCAALWSLVDAQKLRKEKRLFFLLVLCFVVLFAKQVWSVWDSFHPARFPDAAYTKTLSVISSIASPGERVFHTSWDEFPMLFAADDRLKYIAGLDPTFLYVASSTLSDTYRDVTLAAASTTSDDVFRLVHDQLQSRFIFVSKKNHANFLNLVLKDTRFVQIADESDSAAFLVLDHRP